MTQAQQKPLPLAQSSATVRAAAEELMQLLPGLRGLEAKVRLFDSTNERWELNWEISPTRQFELLSATQGFTVAIWQKDAESYSLDNAAPTIAAAVAELKRTLADAEAVRGLLQPQGGWKLCYASGAIAAALRLSAKFFV